MSNLLKVWCWRDRLYRIHVVTGLAAAVWFLLMAVSGVLINHQESLGLLDAEVSDRYLPGYYRADARTGTTRLNILITDLHSGRIFGSRGPWMSDIVALLLVVSLLTGFLSHQLKKRLQATNHRDAARVLTPPPPDPQWKRDASAPVAVSPVTVPDDSPQSSRPGVAAH
jgi:hypothetical protein